MEQSAQDKAVGVVDAALDKLFSRHREFITGEEKRNTNRTINLTINGANALKLHCDVGSLAVGKLADLAVIDMSQLVTMPVLDVLSNVIYAVEAQCVHQVWVSGSLVANIQQGKLLRPDRGKLLTKSNIMSWQNRVCEILRDDFN